MASIANDDSGRKRILFVDSQGDRKTIRLGKLDKRSADAIARHVEALLSSKISGQPIPRDTAAWLASIGHTLRAKLATAGLAEAQQRTKLGDFLDTFIGNRKPTAARNTIINLEQAKKRLVEFFGENRDVASITLAEAEAWAAALNEKYAPATAGRTIKRARQFFKAALRNKVIAENVFIDVKASGQANKERQYFVPQDVILRVMDAAPDAEWRLLIALSRFGGLRCPSEHLALKWSDIDWVRNRFRVESPKTGERWIPIFPELRPYLDDCHELAKKGTIYVINRYRDTNANLRTTFTKIIRRAGEKPWPKLFHNLRASRETELAAQWPIHVVCEWIGNSAAIAAKHYLTVRESDYEKAAQNTAQSTSEMIGGIVNTVQYGDEKTLDFPRVSEHCSIVNKRTLPPRGVEPTQKIQGKWQESRGGGAKYGALDAELSLIMERWAVLPRDVKDTILAMIDSGQQF